MSVDCSKFREEYSDNGKVQEIYYGDTLVRRGEYKACTGHYETFNQELYEEYVRYQREKDIEKLLEEEKYSKISEELILMGLPSGKPFNNLGNHPLWNKYVDWYTEFHKNC